MAVKKKPAAAEPAWPADKVERRTVESLIPYARNSRTHSEDQVAQIAASIREWGWTNPVLVDEQGGIIAGHGRILAAKKLGIVDVPCVVAMGWTEAQRRAYVIADNQLALNAGWDEDLRKIELLELIDLDFDIGLMGFNPAEIDAILADGPTEGLTDPDAVPEPPAIPVSVAGDIWVMGRHRIICGSSTDAETVGALLEDARPHLMVTDPPYGVEYDPSWREKAGVAGGDYAKGKVLNDDNADWREAWALFRGDVAYVWHAGLFAGVVGESLVATGFKLRSQVIWDKGQLVLSRSDYHWQHEPCWYAVREGRTGHWASDRKQVTVWQIDKPRKSETGHGTQKPIECMKRPIENNSQPGDAVYEPFSGSGTTIIAAEMTGRSCYAIELNPAYVDVAVLRWQEFVGAEAVLLGDGRSFAEVGSERAA